MAYYLPQHPDIYMATRMPPDSALEKNQLQTVFASVKELHYWGTDLHFRPGRMGEREYLDYFSSARDESRVAVSFGRRVPQYNEDH